MFYCDYCAGKNDWPISLMRSYGQCEVCRQAEPCNDVPSRLLPLAAREDGE